jgi:hypothetical protein
MVRMVEVWAQTRTREPFFEYAGLPIESVIGTHFLTL